MTNVKMDYAAAAKTVQNDSKLLGRFFLKLGPPGPGCWMWEGYKNDKGYGQFSVGRKMYRAHRLSYALAYGAPSPDLEIDHICNNPSCCRPDHLRAVTSRENCRRGGNAAKTHCKHGHEFTDENTAWRKDGTERVCRECERERGRRSWRKRKGGGQANRTEVRADPTSPSGVGPQPAAPDLRELYDELLYEVMNKVPGESRHETARRIIHEHETRQSDGPGQKLDRIEGSSDANRKS
jgi:hypothetical protein